MAITQNPIIGRAKQKLSNAVFTTWHGRNVLRSKPLMVRNPKTQVQIFNRFNLSVYAKLAALLGANLNTVVKKTVPNLPQRSIFIKNALSVKPLLNSGMPGQFTIVPGFYRHTGSGDLRALSGGFNFGSGTTPTKLSVTYEATTAITESYAEFVMIKFSSQLYNDVDLAQYGRYQDASGSIDGGVIVFDIELPNSQFTNSTKVICVVVGWVKMAGEKKFLESVTIVNA